MDLKVNHGQIEGVKDLEFVPAEGWLAVFANDDLEGFHAKRLALWGRATSPKHEDGSFTLYMWGVLEPSFRGVMVSCGAPGLPRGTLLGYSHEDDYATRGPEFGEQLRQLVEGRQRG